MTAGALLVLAATGCAADRPPVLSPDTFDAGISPADAPVDVPRDLPRVVDARPPVDGPPPPPPRGDVHVVITADNAYGFGYGGSASMMNYFGGVENTSAAAIFECPVGNGPERYVVPSAEAPTGAFLYIVTWSDMAVTQGVIAQFRREGEGAAVYTGDPRFEVCATGVPFDLGSRGPSLEVINEQIARCNARSGDPATTSAGWVTAVGTDAGALAIGEDNTTDRAAPAPGNEFPVACGIDPQARWMWFNWSPATLRWPTDGSPFLYPAPSGNPTKQFLIFRLGTEYIPS
ncbi:MAG: hypothetical protein Q8S73_23780 [Deltaproteobacteria bacterium]|nr:hypothetical protein [Myxococcales bacterium]MDP3217152.1 hypothetical protein [Deltaproteobacteria bacterium]